MDACYEVPRWGAWLMLLMGVGLGWLIGHQLGVRWAELKKPIKWQVRGPGSTIGPPYAIVVRDDEDGPVVYVTGPYLSSDEAMRDVELLILEFRGTDVVPYVDVVGITSPEYDIEYWGKGKH